MNNSFIYRTSQLIKTNKSTYFISLKCPQPQEIDVATAFIGTPPSFNNDFKRISAASGNLGTYQVLDVAINQVLSSFGVLAFVLVGSIDDTATYETDINNRVFNRLKLDPRATEIGAINNQTIIVNTLCDPEAIWNHLQPELERQLVAGGSDAGQFRESMAIAMERARTEAAAPLSLKPGRGGGILTKISISLDEQILQYDAALNLYTRNHDRTSLNEMLRISYNFATDANRLIKLLVSVSDLKPLVLWCTIAEHLELAEAFRQLPWVRERDKPSLGNYERMIKDARNHVFHNLFSFERCLDVKVDELILRPRKMQLFRAHAKKDNRALELEDQELLDLLAEFTRAPETAVSIEFWRRNQNVMKATAALVKKTGEALTTIHKVMETK
jgi:hypothetical protein